MTNKAKIIVAVIIVVVAAASATGYFYYKDSNKLVHSSEEVMEVGGIEAVVTAHEKQKVRLPVGDLEKYGGVDSPEDCQTFSDELYEIPSPVEDFPPGYTSKRTECEIRNNKRKDVKNYSQNNSRFKINYELTGAKGSSADLSEFDIKIEPASGKDVTEEVFLTGVDYYIPSGPEQLEMPSGSLNQGITRSFEMWADINNSESTVDVIFTYEGVTKITRINL